MLDAVVRMDWRRVVPWKVLSLAAHVEGPLVPVAYGGNVFPREVASGSTLWVVTREHIKEPYYLLARMKVAEVHQAKDMSGWWPPGTRRLFDTWKRVALSDADDSRFFEANDADADLKRLGIRFYGPFRYLRNPKVVAAAIAARLNCRTSKAKNER
jgi:hypothetical protein